MHITNKYNLPKPIVDAIRDHGYDSPDGLSVTSLINPAYQRRLMRDYKDQISVDAADSLWALLGTSVHAIIEQAGTDIIKELRVYNTIDGQLISGKSDYYHPVDKELVDFKVTSKYAVKYGKVKPEWEAQLNILSYLLESIGLEVRNIAIMAILRDWMNVDKLKHDFSDIPFMMIKVNKWPSDQTLTYIKQRIQAHTDAANLPLSILPICTPQERWATEETYALRKKTHTRATKLFDDMEEATVYMNREGITLSPSSQWILEPRPGTDNRCSTYCSVKSYCKYAIEKGY